MSIIAYQDFTLMTSLDKESKLWTGKCLTCYHEELTDNKNDCILEFTGHLCKKDALV